MSRFGSRRRVVVPAALAGLLIASAALAQGGPCTESSRPEIEQLLADGASPEEVAAIYGQCTKPFDPRGSQPGSATTGLANRNNIRFRVIGRLADLAPTVRDELQQAMRDTAGNGGMQFNIALSYGGRAEIVDACRTLVSEGIRAEDLTEQRLSEKLYTAGQPDPDLLIRTSGEMRVSNFLLWQIAYAEIWVTPTLWPDFRRRHLFQAIVDFQRRERRYGGLDPKQQTRGSAALASG